MFKKKIHVELDAILQDLRVNLENNYKDLAHDALKRLHATLEDHKTNGTLKEKDYLKYKKIADDYSKRMEHYHH
ncbi:MAG: hypothetical protein Q4D51_09100 [Eubacteriales bacterium]|nr:hypothetical protein [Eubacteriales bacterium]